MNYRPNSKKKYLKELTAVLIVVSLLAAASLYRPALSAALSDWGQSLWQWQGRLSDSRERLALYFRSKKNLANRVIQLEELLGQRENLELALTVLQLENELLKEYWGRRLDSSYLLAAVLVRPTDSPYDTLIIDVGREEGARIGDLVVAYPNIALGKIAGLGAHTSQLELFSSPELKTNVLVGPDFLSAQAEGVGAGNFLLELPREFGVATATAITLPALASYILARVAAVESSSAGASQLLRLVSPINYQELKWVFLVK